MLRPFKISLVILGSLVALAGIGALIGGLVLSWVYGTERGGDGYFTASTDRRASAAHAITFRRDRFLAGPDAGPWTENLLGDMRLRASSPTGEVFVVSGSSSVSPGQEVRPPTSRRG